MRFSEYFSLATLHLPIVLLFTIHAFVFLIALHCNNLFLLAEGGSPQMIHLVQKKSQIKHQTPLLMGTCREPETESLSLYLQV